MRGTFADLKNDFVFRKVFGEHPDALTGLLNDLLGLEGDARIASLEYLPSEQAPPIPGFKLSILDVKCRDAQGRVFVVEMQVVHIKGFLNRVVYNAAKAFIAPLKPGGRYADLVPVVGVSVCDFALWPDDERDAAGLPRVPMVSRWRYTERATGAPGVDQVQFVFLELEKLGERVPTDNVERWAALFAHAQDMTAESVRGVPLTAAQLRALEVAQLATFTATENDAYQRVHDEVQQALQLAEEREERGLKRGIEQGVELGLRPLVRQFERRLGRALTDAERDVLRARLTTLGAERLGDVALDGDAEALVAWLDDPSAR